MTITPAKSGFLLLDASLNLVESNTEAVKILSYPNKPDRVKQLQSFLSDRVRSTLIDHGAVRNECLVNQFRSGRRQYFCRKFGIDLNVRHSAQPATAILLQRNATAEFAVNEICRDFELTRRERETVHLLFQGLTTKEIASRLGVSSNTIKAFIRLVMVKMNVSTRSGIVGRIAATAHFLPPQASV